MKPATPSHLVTFGVFEVDLRAGEVRKHGLKVRLPEQPFQVLSMLLERPGEVVTREELHRRLWSTDTFIDFDHGINAAINKIREALGDSADNPRFVETLPRRGYRFIYPLELGAELTPPSELKPTAGAARESPLGKRRSAVVAAVAFVAIVVAVAGWFWLRHSRPAPPLTAVPLTTYPGSEGSPSFSPDGSEVAFSWNGEKEDNFDIYVKAVGSEPPLRLTTNPARDFSPAWSPDGRWVAFCRDLPEGNYAAVLISPIGGAERILTETSYQVYTLEGHLLAWSARFAMAGDGGEGEGG